MPARGTLPAGPFLAWADRLDIDLGVIGGAATGLQDGSLTRAVYRARHEQSMVSLRTVDQYFIAAGHPEALAMLYPQDVVMEECWCPGCVEVVAVGEDERCPWCERWLGDGDAPELTPVARATGGQYRANERRRRAKQMRAEGKRYRDICAELGVAKSTVSGYVNSADEAS